MIVGSSGAGKSVFSRNLHQITNIPLYPLDKIFWKPGWEESDKADFREKVLEIAKKDTWIIDGNYGDTIEIRAAEADTIIFFDYPRSLCIWRAMKRFLKGRLFQVKRKDISEDCEERMNWPFFMWIWTYPHKGRKKALAQIEAAGFSFEKIIFIKRERDKNRFLKNKLTT